MNEGIVTDDVWVVSKLNHDENRGVGPRIKGEMIGRSAGTSDPEHTRFYARQLLAAAVEVERRNASGAGGCGYSPHGHPCCGLAPIGLRPAAVARCGGAGLCRECREWAEANCAQVPA